MQDICSEKKGKEIQKNKEKTNYHKFLFNNFSISGYIEYLFKNQVFELKLINGYNKQILEKTSR